MSGAAALFFQASFSASLTDPSGSRSLVNAVQWLEGTALGSIATSVAVVAIGVVGMMALTGRMPWRRGATVVIGCFILFGAPSIAAGIRNAASGFAGSPDPIDTAATDYPSPLQNFSELPLPQYDPYAGASVPPR